MTSLELFLCILAVCSSSLAQLGIKYASQQVSVRRALCFLFLSGGIMFFSLLVAIWALRTIQLSQLMPFAALAYVLVPLLGRHFFNESLDRHFWSGVMLIIVGIIIAHPGTV